VKDVHKVPPLDLVGWYTTLPSTGPDASHLPLHKQILQTYNESALLLAFHPSAVLEGSAGGKLPLTIYESTFESDDVPTKKSGEDEEMQDGEPKLGLRFTEVPYTIETGEAEFISVDFVARGGGNATAVDGTVKKSSTTTETSKSADAPAPEKPKGKAKKEETSTSTSTDDHQILSREDEEAIASLTAKANAIKMLHARINLIATYLRNLPSSSLPSTSSTTQYPPVNHEILRSIQSLLSRLTLLIPANSTGFSQELISEQNDVTLVGLLNSITQSVKDVRELGKKFSIVDSQKNLKNKSSGGGGGGWEMPTSGAHGYGGNGVLGVGDLLT